MTGMAIPTSLMLASAKGYGDPVLNKVGWSAYSPILNVRVAAYPSVPEQPQLVSETSNYHKGYGFFNRDIDLCRVVRVRSN
jgi:hypothetical protein